MSSYSPDEEQRARENLKALSDLREKTELLCEHVENRKEALEEEIEESIHEALRNARDSMEKVAENIEPKLENTIKGRLDTLRQQMDDWKYEAREMVRDEIDKKSGDMNQKLLSALDSCIEEKLSAVREELKNLIAGEIKTHFDSESQKIRDDVDQKIQMMKTVALVGLGVGVAGLIGVLFLWFAR